MRDLAPGFYRNVVDAAAHRDVSETHGAPWSLMREGRLFIALGR